MRLVDSDDGDTLSRLVGAVCAELRGARLGGPADDGGDGLRPLLNIPTFWATYAVKAG